MINRDPLEPARTAHRGELDDTHHAILGGQQVLRAHTSHRQLGRKGRYTMIGWIRCHSASTQAQGWADARLLELQNTHSSSPQASRARAIRSQPLL